MRIKVHLYCKLETADTLATFTALRHCADKRKVLAKRSFLYVDW
jgi:hypothetical protein